MDPRELTLVLDLMSANVAVLRAEPGYPVVAMTRQLRAMSIDPDNVLGRPVFELFPETPEAAGSTAKLGASFQRVIESRAPDHHEQRYDVFNPATGDFEERYWSAVNSPILDDAGDVEYILHQAEDAAIERRRGSMAILDAMTEGVFTLDRRWRFNYLNREAYRILGQPPGSLVGGVIWELYPGAEDSEIGENYRRTMHRRETTRFTAYYAGLDLWCDVTAHPAPEGISVYFRDVTTRVTAERERERLAAGSEHQRRLYEAALNNTPDFVFVFGPDRRVIYANDALLKAWGRHDARGMTLTDLGYEAWQVDFHEAEIDQVIATATPIRREMPYTGTAGRRIYDYITVPVFDAEGRVVAVAGTGRDVTEREAMHAHLQEADRRKDEFLAMLAHELRNPLAPIATSAQILKRSLDEPARVRAAAEVIERQVHHLTSLVDDLLDVSRVTRGLVRIDRMAVDLRAVIAAATEQVQPLLQSRGHQLGLSLAPGAFVVHGDSNRLVQVVANLLNNAAKYTAPGGSITLELARDDAQALIRVSDNGAGISAGFLPNVFGLFTQAERTPDRAQGGLGIGLALVKSLVNLHGGTVEACSEGAGHGSTFTVRLPVAEGVLVADAAHSIEPSAHGGRHILLVDDNLDAVDSLAELLGLLGHRVTTASDGASALAASASATWDACVLDIGLPDMTGFELAERLRRETACADAHFIALTGYGQVDDRVMSTSSGFDHHMVKPPDLSKLVDILDRR